MDQIDFSASRNSVYQKVCEEVGLDPSSTGNNPHVTKGELYTILFEHRRRADE